ncbi:MAG: L-amino acid N-acyltransferase YncA [Bradymonadia bacterium]|jgi:L-amino acid N-acyltransferase YncA
MRIVVSCCLLLPLLAFAEPPASQPAASQPAASQPAASQPAASQPAKSYDHAADALAALDPRKPVALIPMMAWHQKQNMQQHLQAIERIIAGAAAGKWGAVMLAARTIESSPEMQQMCHHMGKGAEGFTALALDFHKRADAIRPAAKKKDLKAVLAATANTLNACNGCHSAFRQDVVDSATWQERTGSPAPQ